MHQWPLPRLPRAAVTTCLLVCDSDGRGSGWAAPTPNPFLLGPPSPAAFAGARDPARGLDPVLSIVQHCYDVSLRRLLALTARA